MRCFGGIFSNLEKSDAGGELEEQSKRVVLSINAAANQASLLAPALRAAASIIS
jgi:hypothetical protein